MIYLVVMKSPVGAAVGDGEVLVSLTRRMGFGAVVGVGIATADVVEAERRRSRVLRNWKNMMLISRGT